MRRRDRNPAERLRFAVEALPRRAREAMLRGVDSNPIIVGAYVDRDGGICPMLAAHRNGGRTSLASFARAWDRYTGATRRSRPASARELNTLRAMLEASIGLEEVPSLQEVRRPEPSYPVGWAWMRPFRRFDDYERALVELDLAVAGPDGLELGHDAVAGRAQ